MKTACSFRKRRPFVLTLFIQEEIMPLRALLVTSARNDKLYATPTEFFLGFKPDDVVNAIRLYARGDQIFSGKSTHDTSGPICAIPVAVPEETLLARELQKSELLYTCDEFSDNHRQNLFYVNHEQLYREALQLKAAGGVSIFIDLQETGLPYRPDVKAAKQRIKKMARTRTNKPPAPK
jgi:hypothetical protein